MAAQTLKEEGLSPAAAADPVRDTMQRYDPAYFARFAPRNALDMLNRVPGFDVDQARTGENRRDGGDRRGFGLASEKILINRERLSSKADSVADQLARIPAKNVLRIEIVDGATLDIPGLSGQVANIVVQSSGDLSGQFEWSPQFRSVGNRLTPERLEVSMTGALGPVDFTLALDALGNDFLAAGRTTLTAPDGTPIEIRESDYHRGSFIPTLSATFGYASGGGLIANLNGSMTLTDSFADEIDTRQVFQGIDRAQVRRFEYDGDELEIGGDVEFDLGPGRLKLIGVYSDLFVPISETAVTTFVDASPDTGTRFTIDRNTSERIGRIEYKWPLLGLDWQVSGEAAFNTLDNVSALFVLDPAGDFVAVSFPGGSGGVSEDRYEAIVSTGGGLLPGVTFQIAGGAEFSTIAQTGIGNVQRSFTRPKGTASLSWSASPRTTFAFELARRVGQLDFADFLATVSLAEGTEDAANAKLVPQQSWEAELEMRSDLGRWGNATFTLFHQRIEDLVDFIALPGGIAARGNIEAARRSGAEIDATFELAALGWKGARLDVAGRLERSRLDDPVDGVSRTISQGQPHRLALDLRHDVPGTQWAWGGGVVTTRTGRYYRVGEIGRTYNGPDTWSVFGEHKNVLGLTVRAEVVGIFGPRRRQIRTIYDGVRGQDPILFKENRDQRIGQIYALSISGNF